MKGRTAEGRAVDLGAWMTDETEALDYLPVAPRRARTGPPRRRRPWARWVAAAHGVAAVALVVAELHSVIAFLVAMGTVLVEVGRVLVALTPVLAGLTLLLLLAGVLRGRRRRWP